MPKICLSKDVDYVTMINYFSVAPDDLQKFAEIEVEEINKYGDKMDSALAASFHRSIEGSRVFNYAQWQSQEALKASQQTEEFKAHIDRMSHLDFSPDPRIYEVVGINGTKQPVIDRKSDLVTVLTMIYAQPGSQSSIVEFINSQHMSEEGIISSYLLRSRDEERVVVYTQCCDRAFAKSQSSLFTDIAELTDKIETLPYKVLGSYN